MQFTTLSFTLFFLTLLTIWWGVLPSAGATSWRKAVLLIFSLVFYASSDARWVGVVAGVAAVTWWGSGWIAQATAPQRPRRAWLVISVLLLHLVIWKYVPAFIEAHNAWVSENAWTIPEWAYPVGLSFFTFHGLACVLSVWTGGKSPKSWWDTITHISFFPTLLAGPVLAPDALSSRWSNPFHWRTNAWLEGTVLVMWGMTFKWVFSSAAGAWVDPVFQGLTVSAGDVWWGVHAYAAQIFFDFAGYSLMALGVALLLGFRLPDNFRQPYTATSVQDFWRRWHRSLSFFFRDNVYIPLLGGRVGVRPSAAPQTAHMILAASATMLLSGVWHGASVTFLVWGAWHAAALAIERLLPGRDRWPTLVARLVTIETVVWGWVWFRSDSVETALRLLTTAWTGAGGFAVSALSTTTTPLWWACLMIALISSERVLLSSTLGWAKHQDQLVRPTPTSWLSSAALSMWAALIIWSGPTGVPPFIYNGF